MFRYIPFKGLSIILGGALFALVNQAQAAEDEFGLLLSPRMQISTSWDSLTKHMPEIDPADRKQESTIFYQAGLVNKTEKFIKYKPWFGMGAFYGRRLAPQWVAQINLAYRRTIFKIALKEQGFKWGINALSLAPKIRYGQRFFVDFGLHIAYCLSAHYKGEINIPLNADPIAINKVQAYCKELNIKEQQGFSAWRFYLPVNVGYKFSFGLATSLGLAIPFQINKKNIKKTSQLLSHTQKADASADDRITTLGSVLHTLGSGPVLAVNLSYDLNTLFNPDL